MARAQQIVQKALEQGKGVLRLAPNWCRAPFVSPANA
jgi:hypothetical protein